MKYSRPEMEVEIIEIADVVTDSNDNEIDASILD